MTEQEREKVREQLSRILETHHFKNSRRYPPLLRFIVEETLEGRGEFLKERLLGVRVFERPADYDTAADPIVRVTVAEIRKRIAQYYHDEAHDAEMRIELLPGRYTPEFRWARNGASHAQHLSAAEAAELHAMGVAADALATSDSGTRTVATPAIPDVAQSDRAATGLRTRHIAMLTAALIVIALAAITIWRWLHPSALDQLWSPFTTSARPILFCLPTDVGQKRGPNGEPVSPPAWPSSRIPGARASAPTFLDYESLGENVVYSDMLATLHVANILAAHHHDYHTRLNNSTSLEDLRQGPAVLIGGLDNQWTMRALAPLRFHFAGSDEDRYWIADATRPGFKDWSLDLKLQWGAVTRDYAIIARLRNEQTGEPEMIIAGIGMSGTAAAGEFIADPRRLEELRQRIGPSFKDRDFEAVISTDVVNGIAGEPKILAVQ
jgi:hypothetical protein